MPWTVPDRIKLTMLHQLEMREEVGGVVRIRKRETTCVVRRPERGEARMALECGHCGREGVFVVQDRATTKRLRRRGVVGSLITSAVLVAVVVVLAVLGFGGDDVLFQVLLIPGALILLPFAGMLAVDPSGNIGVEAPEFVSFASDTRRQGLSYVTRGEQRRLGVSCSGHAAAAP
ncbi:hypothetical protein [Streptomyces sp. NPDC058953]|uniref:hypothetical protein n=1 Tax=unclassified Streptomyces TaxID=2593676 RepID=UPI0036AC249B